MGRPPSPRKGDTQHHLGAPSSLRRRNQLQQAGQRPRPREPRHCTVKDKGQVAFDHRRRGPETHTGPVGTDRKPGLAKGLKDVVLQPRPRRRVQVHPRLVVRDETRCWRFAGHCDNCYTKEKRVSDSNLSPTPSSIHATPSPNTTETLIRYFMSPAFRFDQGTGVTGTSHFKQSPAFVAYRTR